LRLLVRKTVLLFPGPLRTFSISLFTFLGINTGGGTAEITVDQAGFKICRAENL
jgi:hypothetical protein